MEYHVVQDHQKEEEQRQKVGMSPILHRVYAVLQFAL